MYFFYLLEKSHPVFNYFLGGNPLDVSLVLEMPMTVKEENGLPHTFESDGENSLLLGSGESAGHFEIIILL